MLGYISLTPYLYYVLREIDMTQPHIKSSWLTNGRMMVLVLFPNGVERVMDMGLVDFEFKNSIIL